MVYGVLLLIKMKNSSTSSRSRSSSRSSSRATSPTRATGSNNVPDPPQGKDRRPLSWGSAPAPSLCGDVLDTPEATLQPKKTKANDKSPCFNTSPHASRRTQKPHHRSRSSSGSSSRTGSPTGILHKRNSSSVTVTPASRTPSATPAARVTSAAMTRDQRIRRWLQGLKQESLEASIPEEDVPGREDSLEEELPCATHGSSVQQEASVPTWQNSGNRCIKHMEEDKSK